VRSSFSDSFSDDDLFGWSSDDKQIKDESGSDFQKAASANRSIQLPTQFEPIINKYKDTDKVSLLYGLYEEICKKISIIYLYSLRFFPSTHTSKDWSSLKKSEQGKIIKIIDLVFEDDCPAYQFNLAFIANLIILCKDNKMLSDLLINSSSVKRIDLINRLINYCNKYYISLDEIDYHSFIPKLSFLIDNKMADEIEYLYFPNSTSIKKYNASPKKDTETNDNDLKLHLTLHWDDYCAHRKNIENLLIPYVIDGTIPEFKYFKSAIDIDLETLRKSKEFKLLDKSIHRFIFGDQVTIYLYPENDIHYSKEKIALMCQHLNDYCHKNYLREGAITYVESPISLYLNLRQQREDGTYVDAITNDKYMIKTLRENQEQSDLYLFLVDKGELSLNFLA
jgi:hypothetical protein